MNNPELEMAQRKEKKRDLCAFVAFALDSSHRSDDRGNPDSSCCVSGRYLARQAAARTAGSDDKPAASAEERLATRKNNMDAIGGQWKTA